MLNKIIIEQVQEKMVYTGESWSAKLSTHILFLIYRSKLKSTLAHKKQKWNYLKLVENQKIPGNKRLFPFLFCIGVVVLLSYLELPPQIWKTTHLKADSNSFVLLGMSAVLPRNADMATLAAN